MRPLLPLLFLLCASGATAEPLHAQQPVPLAIRPAASPLFEMATTRESLRAGWVAPDTTAATTQATYWREGAVGGTTLLGVGGALLAAGLCHADDSRNSCTPPIVGTAALGAVAGGVTGALIGGSFAKHPEATPPR